METVVKDLPNISEFRDLTHIPYLLAAILLVDTFTMGLTRFWPEKVGGETLNQWYDNFGLEGVIADIFIILIGFIITQFLYSYFIQPSSGWKPVYFMLLAVLVQVIHDIVFYYGVIKPVPFGVNDMIDSYKAYAAENGSLIIPGDSLLVLFSGLVAFGLEMIPPYAAVAIGVVTMYILPYMLTMKMQTSYRWKREKASSPSQEKQEKQEKQGPTLTPQMQQSNPQQAERRSPWQGQGVPWQMGG